MKVKNEEIIIIGGGIVGLTLAYQLLKRKITSSIYIIDSSFLKNSHQILCENT